MQTAWGVDNACLCAWYNPRMPKIRTPKRYYNIRIDERTYEALRKLTYKRRMKIIDVMRETFA